MKDELKYSIYLLTLGLTLASVIIVHAYATFSTKDDIQKIERDQGKYEERTIKAIESIDRKLNEIQILLLQRNQWKNK